MLGFAARCGRIGGVFRIESRDCVQSAEDAALQPKVHDPASVLALILLQQRGRVGQSQRRTITATSEPAPGDPAQTTTRSGYH